MAGFGISELARRSGFPASTLRYYEAIGLIEPPGRSAAGYRIYDDETVERLVFIAGAKRLGLTLNDIAELAGEWSGGECRHVRQRLEALVSAKIDSIDRETAALSAWRSQMDRTRERLRVGTPSTNCGPDCGCLADLAPADLAPADLALGTAGRPAIPFPAMPAPPLACSLAPDEAAERTQDWTAIAGQAQSCQPIPGGLRLGFDPAPAAAARLAGLAALEAGCCAFFVFRLEVSADRLWLDVEAPRDAQELVAAIFASNR